MSQTPHPLDANQSKQSRPQKDSRERFGHLAGRKPAKTEADLQAEITRLRAVVAELSLETLALKKGRWP